MKFEIRKGTENYFLKSKLQNDEKILRFKVLKFLC